MRVVLISCLGHRLHERRGRPVAAVGAPGQHGIAVLNHISISDWLAPGTRTIRERRRAAERSKDMSASEDPTQGRKIGADPHEDPTQGRKVGADPDEDPTQGRKVGADPDEDPTQGRKVGADPHEDPTQGRKVGADPDEDPTQGR